MAKVLKTKKGIELNTDQYDQLVNLSNKLNDLTGDVSNIGKWGKDNLKEIGYEIGKVTAKLEFLGEELEELLDEIDNTISEDDDQNNYVNYVKE